MKGICPNSCTYFCISFLAMSLGLFEVAEKQDRQGTTTRDPDFLREVPGGVCFVLFWFWSQGRLYPKLPGNLSIVREASFPLAYDCLPTARLFKVATCFTLQHPFTYIQYWPLLHLTTCHYFSFQHINGLQILYLQTLNQSPIILSASWNLKLIKVISPNHKEKKRWKELWKKWVY